MNMVHKKEEEAIVMAAGIGATHAQPDNESSNTSKESIGSAIEVRPTTTPPIIQPKFRNKFFQKLFNIVTYVPPRCRYDENVGFYFGMGLNVLFAFAAAFTVAVLYYNHPILNKLAETFDVTYERASVIPNVMQGGYACGLLLITPLGDLFPRRTLTLGLILITALVWIGLCVTSNFQIFAALSFVCGFTTVVPQLMLPLVGDLAPENKKAAYLAVVSSGLMVGQLIARILSGVVTEYTSWRTVYWIAFGLQIIILILLYFFMPDYPSKNPAGLTYLEIMRSMLRLIKNHPLLVQASFNGFALSGTFMIYWTTLTALLADAPYFYSSAVIGLFGLIGISAIFCGPLVGRFFTDKWNPLVSTILGSIITLIGQIIGTYIGTFTVAGPILQAWLLDLGIQTANVANRAAIYKLDGKAKNRINSVYMLFVFFGQVMGTGAGNKALADGGWIESGSLSVGFCVLALLFSVSRGPHEKGWVGWRGGVSFRLERNEEGGSPVSEKAVHVFSEVDEEKGGAAGSPVDEELVDKN